MQCQSNSYGQDVVFIYSVMQSDGKSFGEDVVLDSVDMAYREEDSILDQIYEIYENKYFLDIYNEDFDFFIPR